MRAAAGMGKSHRKIACQRIENKEFTISAFPLAAISYSNAVEL